LHLQVKSDGECYRREYQHRHEWNDFANSRNLQQNQRRVNFAAKAGSQFGECCRLLSRKRKAVWSVLTMVEIR
jgi:hypothetical protein